MSLPDFTGKVAVVTGGGRGIGAATARLLASVGARVAVAARSPDEIDAVAAAIREGGGEATAIPTDVAAEEDVRRLFAGTSERLGPVDLLVNNAAVLEVSPVAETGVDAWDRLMAVNLRGAFLCAREAMRIMTPRRTGAIVNVSSVSGVPGPEKWPGYAAYCASKGGLISFSEVLALEAKPHGIRVNAISPGSVDTAMWRRSSGGAPADMSPEEVGRAILFLLSGEARPVVGANLHIFG